MRRQGDSLEGQRQRAACQPIAGDKKLQQKASFGDNNAALSMPRIVPAGLQ